LTISNVLDGMSRERATEQAEIDQQSLRDCVIRFNAESIPGQQDGPRSGRLFLLDDGVTVCIFIERQTDEIEFDTNT
jgi:hypothetical protein